MMKQENISRLFYREYYREVDFNYILDGSASKESKDAIRKMNQQIISSGFLQIEIDKELYDKQREFNFQLKVCYPGLVTGTGLVHGSKNLDGAFNLGMHFDYTTGMPIVYGSSVKGVLRSYFNDFCLEDEVTEGDIKSLEKEIFEGKRKDGSMIPVYKRDVFFDAVIVKPSKKNGRFLEDDSITPHTGGPLKNPIPIAMLKIASGCIMEFRFILHDSEINKKYNGNWKKELFKSILCAVGVGAKTNVGYGQLQTKSENVQK